MEFDDLPPHVREAVTRREAFTSPISSAIDSLGFTWEIAGGNLTVIYATLKRWEGDGWRGIHGDGQAKHRYHRELIRQFHNFLSSAISAVWHANRIVGRLKGLAPQLSDGFKSRLATVEGSDDFLLLEQLRNYAIHTGHHLTVLALEAASSPTGDVLVPKVRFEVEELRSYVQTQLHRARTQKRNELSRVLVLLDTANRPEMRLVVQTFHRDVGGLLGWLRQELIALTHSAHTRPLKDWSASPETWIDPRLAGPTE